MAIKYININRSPSDLIVNQVYEQIKLEFGILAEPFILHTPSPLLLAGAWCIIRETLLTGNVKREVKEAVAVTVSHLNQCPYCVDAHTIMLHALSHHKVAKNLSHSPNNNIKIREIDAVVKWASLSRSPERIHSVLLPFSGSDMPEVIGTTIAFHYINRMVNVFLSSSPLVLTTGLVRGIQKRLAGKYFSRVVSRTNESGQSIQLLPASEFSDQITWADACPPIKEVFERWYSIVNQFGLQVLTKVVRHKVETFLSNWQGEDMDLGGGWLDEAVMELSPSDQLDAKLALLTAVAPYQISAGIVNDFREKHPDDRDLVIVVAWASWKAAHRIGMWLSSNNV